MVTPHTSRVLGGVPGPGDTASDRVDPAAQNRWKVGVHLDGDGKGGGEVTYNGGLYLAKA